jgi:hypothetical protein
MAQTETPTEEKPIIIQTSSGRSGGGGIVALLTTLGVAAGVGYVGSKMWKAYKDDRDNRKQDEASTHTDDPDYTTAKSLSSLFDLGWYRLGLSADEKAQFKTLYASIKVPKKARDYYTTISKGRSLDDDISKWINAATVKNTQTVQNANNDDYSTWKVDSTGKVFATVKEGDLIVIKKGGTYFKWFKLFLTPKGTPDYAKISENINNTYGKGGDSTIKYEKYLYVGNHIFSQKVYYKDASGVNRLQEKVFAYVYGANGNLWGYVDLFEFQRSKPISGLGAIPQRLIFS